MRVKQVFPASIVDELTCCMEKAWSRLHLVYAWILSLEGDVSTDISLKALDCTLRCYPKCKCILANDYPSCKRWFRYRWVLTECAAKDIVQEIRWPDSAGNINEVVRYYMSNLPSLAIDPTAHIPLKVLLIRTPLRTFFCFIMHHAVADGRGSLSFIQKFISCYEEIIYQREPAGQNTRYQDISLPAIRFQWSNFFPRIIGPYFSYCARFIKESPVRLYAHELPIDSATFVACVRDLPPPRLESIRSTAKQHRATINDHLLASAFWTVKQWTRECALPSGLTYITVPINLRTPEDRTMSNVLSSVTVSLSSEAMGEKEALLPLIREQMTTLDKNEIARTMLNLSCLLQPLPLVLKRFLLKRSFPGFAPTLLLSNLGVLSPNPSHTDGQGFHYMGPARIANIYLIPNAAIWPDLLVSTYNNQIAVTMAVLSSCFSPGEAERFLNSFMENL